MSDWKPVVIVLAAGDGARFRAAGGGDKLDAMFSRDGRCQRVRDHVLDAVRASGLRHHVVERDHAAGVDDPGMGSSIALGVAATPEADGWLILPADLPLIRVDTLLAVAQQLRTHAAVVPVVQGRRGHPVGFRRECGAALLQLRGEQGGRALLERFGAATLELDDVGAVTDVDTPELLRTAQQLGA